MTKKKGSPLEKEHLCPDGVRTKPDICERKLVLQLSLCLLGMSSYLVLTLKKNVRGDPWRLEIASRYGWEREIPTEESRRKCSGKNLTSPMCILNILLAYSALCKIP